MDQNRKYYFQEVDMCITFTPPSITKQNVMDTSYLIYEDDISIGIPYPISQADEVGVLVAPFKANVGASLL